MFVTGGAERLRPARRHAAAVAVAIAAAAKLTVCAAATLMNVNFTSASARSYDISTVRKITYTLTAPVSMNVIKLDATVDTFAIASVRSITFSVDQTGVDHRRLDRIKRDLMSFSVRNMAGVAALAFTLPAAENVTVAVYSVNGQRVRLLASQLFAAGDHVVFWDSHDESGRKVAPGSYIMRIERQSTSHAYKFITVK